MMRISKTDNCWMDIDILNYLLSQKVEFCLDYRRSLLVFDGCVQELGGTILLQVPYH